MCDRRTYLSLIAHHSETHIREDERCGAMPDPAEPLDPFHVAYVLIALVVTFLSCLIMGIMLTCKGAGVCRNVNRAPVSGGTEPEAQAPGGAP